MPTIANGSDASTAIQIACTALTAAAGRLPSPVRRATTAVTAIARPMPMAYSRNRKVSVSPTVATAEAPSLATNQMSTTAKVDSSTSSSTIGTASRNTARRSGIFV